MKFRTLLSGLIAATTLNANAALINYTSSFTDNGNKVTEVRTFNDNSVQTWEWLDLTVTNGISYNSLVADLNNDGLLNNSDSVLNANDGAKLDVAALAVADQSGWNTVSDDGVVDLFNAYFGTSLLDDQYYDFGSNSTLVDDFIKMFGDTFHEGLLDEDSNIVLTTNGEGSNSAYTYGITSSLAFGCSHETANLFDGQFYHASADEYEDYWFTANTMCVSRVVADTGTWLSREAVSGPITDVPEPTTMALFALALSGLVARRRRLI